VVATGVGDHASGSLLFREGSYLVVSTAQFEGSYRLEALGLEVEKPLSA
jgi:hypothetical protein